MLSPRPKQYWVKISAEKFQNCALGRPHNFNKKMFEVCEIEGKGKGVVATCAIKAGEVIHRETPLMMITPEFQERFPDYTIPGTARLLAAVSYFVNRMSPEQQERCLSLHGGQPMESIRKEAMRKLARTIRCQDRPSSEEDVELYARVCMIVCYNAFGGEDETRVYDTASRFCHSCAPNCSETLGKEEIVIRTVRPIQEGEELTLDYFPARQMEPTHVRRKKWVQVKDFTATARAAMPLAMTPASSSALMLTAQVFIWSVSH